MKKTPMTKEAASRIQSAQARQNNGVVKSNTFAARAQSAVQTKTAQPVKTGKK